MLLVAMVGVNVTVMVSPSTVPVAVTTPEVAPTVTEDVYFVEVNEAAQESSAEAPLD